MRWAALLALYVAGMLLTYGYEGHRLNSAAEGGFRAFYWPAYWPFRLTDLAFDILMEPRP